MILKLIYTTAFILLVGLVTPTRISYQDKHITKLDLLAGFIRYTNPNNPIELNYHIASALITKGGSDAALLASIACVESTFNPSVKGDSGKSVGLFQIQPNIWGGFRLDPYSQTEKARRILVSLRTDYKDFVARYNGDGYQSRVYRNKVMAKYKMIRRYV